MKNRIVSIGYMGGQTCYLNLSRDEAIAKYRSDPTNYRADDEDLGGLIVFEFEFDDVFWAYDVRSIEDY